MDSENSWVLYRWHIKEGYNITSMLIYYLPATMLPTNDNNNMTTTNTQWQPLNDVHSQ